jgi:hypothetical protein
MKSQLQPRRLVALGTEEAARGHAESMPGPLIFQRDMASLLVIGAWDLGFPASGKPAGHTSKSLDKNVVVRV